MKKTLFCFGLTQVLFTFAAQAIIVRSEPAFDKKDLVYLIANDDKITQLDHLIPKLPGTFRLNFTLKHGFKRNGERGHLIEDKVSQSADPMAPRAILWDERTGFSVSYNGGLSTQTAPHRLDILSFDKKTKTFLLEQIDFPIQSKSPHLTTSDCASCHGPNHRPIFSMYPDWPSFYGSDNDELTGDKIVQQKELSDYIEFRQNVSSNDRYWPLFDAGNLKKYLGVEMYPTFPYRQNVSEESQAVSRAFTFRAGLRLGIIYNRMNVQMIADRIIRHPRFPLYDRFFVYNLMQCQPSQEGKKKLNSYFAAIKKDLKLQPIIRSNGLMDYSQALRLFGFRVNDTDIRYSYNHSGYQNTDASEKIMEIGYIGNYFNSYFDGSATFDELLAAALVRNLTLRNPRLNNPKIYRGLTDKYQKFTDRFAFDKEFFAEADAWGKWISMPFPTSISQRHHRETFTPVLESHYKAVCFEIEKSM